jgi:hypothetical protein
VEGCFDIDLISRQRAGSNDTERDGGHDMSLDVSPEWDIRSKSGSAIGLFMVKSLDRSAGTVDTRSTVNLLASSPPDDAQAVRSAT